MSQQSTPNTNYDAQKKAVDNFIIACLNHHAKIKSFATLTLFINNNRINLLFPLTKSGQSSDSYGRITAEWCTEKDAEIYFEWLVAVVNETEVATDVIRKNAYEQLFRFLYLMRDSIERSQNYQVIEPYDWQQVFTAYDEHLNDIRRTIDNRDKAIVDVLTSLLEMTKKNVALLKSLENEYNTLFQPKSNPPSRRNP